MLIERPAATEVEGTFRVNGSNKRMRELQAAFESPPRVSLPALESQPSLTSMLSTERTLIGRRRTIQHTTSQVYSDDTSRRCQYVRPYLYALSVTQRCTGTCNTP